MRASIGVHDSIAIASADINLRIGSSWDDQTASRSGGLIDDLFTLRHWHRNLPFVTASTMGVGFTVFETYNANDCDVFFEHSTHRNDHKQRQRKTTDGNLHFDYCTVDTTLRHASIG